MKTITILWVDDEIDLLKPHILFLNSRGYQVITYTNGTDALANFASIDLDLVFLDEHMPGLNGLEILTRMKEIKPSLPIVMITKSEEENLMEEAIGSKISDYLIKPVNPKQILLCIKKLTEQKKLVSEKTSSNYQSEFMTITNLINTAKTYNDWVELYQKLVFWELELEKFKDTGMFEVLQSQHLEANLEFSRFVKRNYVGWMNDRNEKPILSPNVIKDKVAPLLQQGEKVYLVVIDNLRLDQWKTIYPSLSDYLKIEKEELYCSILPTVTQYARNAFFAGLMPLSIRKIYPNLWDGNDEDEINNQYEEELLKRQIARLGLNIRLAYEKISNQKSGQKVLDSFSNYSNCQLVVLVYNFVDILSHARTEISTVRELANDESAYRTLTHSWFQHSSLFDLLKTVSGTKSKIIITTDHGSVRVNNPIRVIGDKETSVNLRYKQGRNLNYQPREVFEIKDPQQVHLPKFNLSTSYIFATGPDFMAYPNNYNHYVSYYKNTFQHGGISMEEMLVPFVQLCSTE